MEAHDKIREKHQQGLMEIDRDFMTRIQTDIKQESLDQIQKLLSTLDLNDNKNDELTFTA
ncbi:hypothetical protein C0J52_28103 [Blattella germanica]|nr:hypothetical protein C0J52_28103 [Blattella germanica]